MAHAGNRNSRYLKLHQHSCGRFAMETLQVLTSTKSLEGVDDAAISFVPFSLFSSSVCPHAFIPHVTGKNCSLLSAF
jgi:hypothetical protein